MGDLFTIEDLLDVADIDDLSFGESTRKVQLTFTPRNGSMRWVSLSGHSVEDVLEQARIMLRRENVLEELRENGLTDEDIDRLSSDPEEIWQLGYIAGATDYEEALRNGAARAAATSVPTAATAAEPLDIVDPGDNVGIPVTVYVPIPGRVLLD